MNLIYKIEELAKKRIDGTRMQLIDRLMLCNLKT